MRPETPETPAGAIAALYEQHRAHLVRHLTRFTGNEHDAEDQLHGAVVAALLARPDEVHPGYLAEAARRALAKQAARRAQHEAEVRRGKRAGASPLEHDPAGPGEAKGAALDRAALLAQVEGRVRPVTWRILTLRASDMPWPDVAAEVGMTVEAVQSHYWREVRKLRAVPELAAAYREGAGLGHYGGGRLDAAVIAQAGERPLYALASRLRLDEAGFVTANLSAELAPGTHAGYLHVQLASVLVPSAPLALTLALTPGEGLAHAPLRAFVGPLGAGELPASAVRLYLLA